MPRTPRSDDVYLVSYPKSGSTWLRFLLGSYLHGPLGRLNDLARLVPDIHRDRPIPEDLPRPRFIKSHAPVTDAYPRVVYLVRDGRDVAVSFYYHARREGLLPEGCGFPAFLERLAAGEVKTAGRWGDHVRGWLEGDADDRLVVKYEDLKTDAAAELARVVEFAAVEVVGERVAAAVEASRFERMQRLEARAKGEDGEEADLSDEERFIRKGTSGDWRDMFGEEALRRFEARNRAGFLAAGYPLHAGTE